ncbi:MAG: NAD(P)/FAD-dependent oxidoreductase [Pseudomonadota bacterium]
MEGFHVETAVIGAGVVGLAVARALALSGRDVVVLERADAIGTETSARNSEVIHAGIYYPNGSNKARFCVAGRHMLYEFCSKRGIPHTKCGKLIVASNDDEMAAFETLLPKAAANGVEDLAPLEAADVSRIEPEVKCCGALQSPSTGIVDSHGFMLALQGEAEDHGAMIAFNTPVEAVEQTNQGFALTAGGEAPLRLTCREFVNAAGHGAVRLARTLAALRTEEVPEAFQAKGVYFRLMGKSPFSRLIYPAPDNASLGVHATVDLGDQTRFGPDVEWIDPLSQDSFDYDVDPARSESFYAAIRKYWPGLKDGTLVPDYSGIRPKVSGPSEPAGDFILSGRENHGLDGLINLFGIESPGLTSALAIADEVASLLKP